MHSTRRTEIVEWKLKSTTIHRSCFRLALFVQFPIEFWLFSDLICRTRTELMSAQTCHIFPHNVLLFLVLLMFIEYKAACMRIQTTRSIRCRISIRWCVRQVNRCFLNARAQHVLTIFRQKRRKCRGAAFHFRILDRVFTICLHTNCQQSELNYKTSNRTSRRVPCPCHSLT